MYNKCRLNQSSQAHGAYAVKEKHSEWQSQNKPIVLDVSKTSPQVSSAGTINKRKTMNLFLVISVIALFLIFLGKILYDVYRHKKDWARQQELNALEERIEKNTKFFISQLLMPEKIRQINDPNLYVSPDEKVKIRFAIFDKKNRDLGEFHVSLPIYDNGAAFYRWDFPKKETSVLSIGKGDEASPALNDLRDALYEINGCKEVLISPYEVRFGKTPALSWDELIPQINAVIFKALDATPAETSESNVLSTEN